MRFLLTSVAGINSTSAWSEYFDVVKGTDDSDLLGKIKNLLESSVGKDTASLFATTVDAGTMSLKLNSTTLSASDKQSVLAAAVKSLQQTFSTKTVSANEDTITVSDASDTATTTATTSLDALYDSFDLDDKFGGSLKPPPPKKDESAQEAQSMAEILKLFLEKLLTYFSGKTTQGVASIADADLAYEETIVYDSTIVERTDSATAS